MKRQRIVIVDTDGDGEAVEPCKIAIRDIAEDVYSYGRDLAGYGLTPEPGSDGVYGDIRIQVHEGSYQIHTGDSQYDQDHRGVWGSGSVPAGVSRRQARQIAVDLLNDLS